MVSKPYTVGSLFAGIGGIDLGLERTGYFRTAWVCERDPYCQRVLAKHWPDATVFDDVADIGEDTPAVDVIAAGFPCQPVSHAGRRKAQDDERWLWPHVERCVRVLRPRGVLLENVAGLFTAGFDDVIGGLAACGYDAEWDCIPAAAVGAPHLRERVFIIATSGSTTHESVGEGWPSPMAYSDQPRPVRTIGGIVEAAGEGGQHTNITGPGRNGTAQAMADTTGEGPQRHGRPVTAHAAGHAAARCAGGTAQAMADTTSIRPSGPWQPIHTIGTAEDASRETDNPIHVRVGCHWESEPNVGRVANGVPRRVDRLRALGNAVVPQVAEYVGHQLFRVMGGADAFTQREAD